MPIRPSFRIALMSSLFAPLLMAANAPLGEVAGEVFTSCEYRVSINFPSHPASRDFTYQDGEHSAPAREFSVEHNGAPLKVMVAHFADGPEEDQSLIDSAVAGLHARGEVLYDAPVFYDTPRIPGHQMSVGLADGRVLRGSVYMARNRLYITEAVGDRADAIVLRFEQSVSLIDENGADLDSNPVLDTPTIGESGGLPSRQYDCGNT